MAPENEAHIKSGVWQGIAQSGVDLSVLPAEQVDQLVTAITRSVASALGDTVAGAPTQSLQSQVQDGGAGSEEQILWEGSPLMALGVKYQITSQRVRIIEGMLNKTREDIELVRIQDIDQTQSVAERLSNVGDIHIRSHDASNPVMTLRNVTDPQGVHEILRRAVLDARRIYDVSYREEM